MKNVGKQDVRYHTDQGISRCKVAIDVALC